MQEPSFIWKYKILAIASVLMGSIIFFSLGKRAQEKTDVTSIEDFFWFGFVFGILSLLFSLFQSKFSESLKEYIKGEIDNKIDKTLAEYQDKMFNFIDGIKSTIKYFDDKDRNDLNVGLERLKEISDITSFDIEVMSCLASYLWNDKQIVEIIDAISKQCINKYCQDEDIIHSFLEDIMNCMSWLRISFEENVPRVIQRDSFDLMTTALRQGLPYGLTLYKDTLSEIAKIESIQKITEKRKYINFWSRKYNIVKKSRVMETHINFLMYDLERLSHF